MKHGQTLTPDMIQNDQTALNAYEAAQTPENGPKVSDPNSHPCSACRCERILRDAWWVCPKCAHAIAVPVPPSIQERLETAALIAERAGKTFSEMSRDFYRIADSLREPLKTEADQPPF